MSINNNCYNNIQRTISQTKRKNHHKYIFSKNNVVNHDNISELNDSKGTTHNNETNQKNFYTNSIKNVLLNKLKNKGKDIERQEYSFMIDNSKKFKKNINLNHNKNKIYSKSLEKKKQKPNKNKNNESSFITHKYSNIISPLNNNNKTYKKSKIITHNSSHKRISSTHLENKEEKKSKYNNSFRGFKKKIKLNNGSFEFSLDNNNTENNTTDHYEKKISLTNVLFNDTKNNINNDIFILSSPKDDSIDAEFIDDEELITMSKKKQEILEEIKLKKQELKLTELSIELLKHKYKKKINTQINPTSTSHINNKIINNYNLTVSIPSNTITKKNSSINNNHSNLNNKKSFFAKTSLHKNSKRISPTYIKDFNNKVNNSFKMRNNYVNNININVKSKNITIRNKSRHAGNSPFEKKMFSFPKKKEKNNEKRNSDISINNKYNINIKNVSPEKDNNNNSIDITNYASSKTNNNINKRKLKINNNSLKNKNYLLTKKKNICKKEVNVKQKALNIKKNNNNNHICSTETIHINNTKIIKDKKYNLNKNENAKNENQSRNIDLSQNVKFICNDIILNESDQDNKSIKSINYSNKDNYHEIVEIFCDNNINNINRENKSILILESICKKGFAGPGIKKTNQDNFFIYNNFNNNPNYVFMGVCDGHGMFGQGVSTYLVNNLPQNLNSIFLAKNIKNLATINITTLSESIQSTFISTNEQLTQDDRIDSAFSGSTCVSLLYTPSRLICINVGDSRCVLGKFDGVKWKAKNLSRDHKPDIAGEKERIIKNGGRVEAYRDSEGNFVGPNRVWVQGGDLPGLAMSRSFGDEIAHLVGVITDPEIIEYYFCKEDKFIIIGSDGLWEFVKSDECIEIVKDYYLEKNVEAALTHLYKEASKRWILEEEIIDDITILIAFLKE